MTGDVRSFLGRSRSLPRMPFDALSQVFQTVIEEHSSQERHIYGAQGWGAWAKEGCQLNVGAEKSALRATSSTDRPEDGRR